MAPFPSALGTLLILLLAVGCVPRHHLVPTPEDASTPETVTVFTATNRSVRDGRPGSERSATVAFTRLDISIPETRRPGRIRTPRGDPPDPATDFLLAGAQPLSGATGFSDRLAAQLRARPAADRDVLLYVHGFNSTFSEGVLRLAQLSHDFDFGTIPVHFAWPSAANPLAYERDRGSALYSRDALERVIRLIRQAGARRIIVVAHSMGAFLTMETLRQMAIADPGSVARDIYGVVLVSPDIDVDVFRAQAKRIGRLPRIFAIFVARRDRVLQLSARLTGEDARLGNLQDPAQLADLKVTLIDVTDFADRSSLGHFVPGTAPELIGILSRAAEIEGAFEGDNAGRTGLLPGSVLTIRNATELVLRPITP